MPGASIPSSLVTRMRARDRSMAGAAMGSADRLDAAHVGAQDGRHGDASLLVLEVLHHRDERAADGDARAIQRVDVARALLPGLAAAGVHAPRLEVAAVRAGRDLAIRALPRQPDLDVVGLARGEAHVARAEQHDPVGQAQAPQHLLRRRRHALMLGGGLLRRRDGDQLDLVELVLAEHPARVLARGPGLGAEAGGVRREAHGQLALVDDLARDEVRERHLGRRDEPVAVGGAEEVVGELRQVAGAERGLVAHEHRRARLGVAELARVYLMILQLVGN